MIERMTEREKYRMEKQLLHKIEKSKKFSWKTLKAVLVLDGLMHNA